MGGVIDWIAERGFRELFDLVVGIGVAIASYAGVQNRRELRNGLGVVKGSRKRPPKMKSRAEAIERSDELPLRALVETSLGYQKGIDDRLERLERDREREREANDAGRAGDLDRRDNG